MFTRRAALETILKSSAGFALLAGRRGFAEPGTPVSLRLGAGAPVKLSDNFTGLGYEMSSVATPGLLSASNRNYVALVKALGSAGVIRVGGIVANYTRYEPHGTAMADRKNTVITDAGLKQFAGFLKTIGWKAIWSVNFAQGSVQDAVIEAKAVAGALGPHLFAIEIGNEIESYGRGRNPFRPPTWDYSTYRKEYEEWHDAIAKAVPGISFAAPDTASNVEWVENMARDAGGKVQLLTTHYYRTNRMRGSAEQLLTPDPRLIDVLTRLRAASQQSGIPWRMCETNSFSGGGRPGVSDTFVGALWTLDYMLLLAKYGCTGVNVETGVNQLGFVSCYSPIQDDGHGTNSAGVPYYGMLAFAEARKDCGEMLPAEFEMQGVNATAYVLGSGGRPRSVVVVNRDQSQEARVSIRDLRMGEVTILRLTAPAANSTTGVTFGGSSVDPAGHWAATKKERTRNGELVISPMTAIMARTSSVHKHA